MSFSERYIQNLITFKFVSFITTTFLLSLLFFEVKESLIEFWYPSSEFDSIETINQRLIAVIFQPLIFLLFIIKFFWLCFNKPRFIWLSQVFWLLNWITIYSYYYITTEIFKCCFGGEHFPSFFLGMLNIVSSWLLAYMFFSPIKQILTLIFAYFYRNKSIITK